MLYPIPSPAALAGLKLAGRAFPYNRGPWPG
jgi:hypothetical protein